MLDKKVTSTSSASWCETVRICANIKVIIISLILQQHDKSSLTQELRKSCITPKISFSSELGLEWYEKENHGMITAQADIIAVGLLLNFRAHYHIMQVDHKSPDQNTDIIWNRRKYGFHHTQTQKQVFWEQFSFFKWQYGKSINRNLSMICFEMGIL